MATPRQGGSANSENDEPTLRADDRASPHLNSPMSGDLNAEELNKPDCEPEKPFSIYTKKEKWYMVAMVALAGLFSALTVALYFPAIPTMATAFGKSTELINLTVTMYMVRCFGVLSLTVWDVDLSISCALRCYSYLASGGGLGKYGCFGPNIGAGVISDIATPAERGGFLGLFTLGLMVGPCVGPVIGGLLSGNLGWRSMFWFLAIATGLMLVFMGLTFPETLRAITGDGSLPPQRWNRTPLSILGRKVANDTNPNANSTRQDPATQRRSPHPLQILRAFTQTDVLIVLICTGIIYSMFYSVPATTATLLQDAYPYLTQSTVGLCFIPLAVGGALGSVGVGKILDHDWRKMEARHVPLELGSPTRSEYKEAGELEKGDRNAHTTGSSETNKTYQ
ncbi:hypothetical protein FRC10_005811 [Ceratobasidium sp. 414]|nr:hypothetical protein FRC10_005811 [Ceratobasidium sp. 414]